MMEHQYRGFCIKQYLKDAREGYRLVWKEFRSLMKFSNRESKISIAVRSNSSSIYDDEDTKEVGLIYGFGLYSKMCASLGCYVLYFITDVKPGLYPSANTVLLFYGSLVGCVIIGSYAMYFIGWQISHIMLRDFVNNFHLAVVFLVMGCLSAYMAHGLLSTLWFVKERRFIHTLISSSSLRTTRSYQRRQMVSIFVSTIVLSSVTEPLYLASTLISCITQVNGFLQNLNQELFLLVKYSMVLILALASFAVGVATCFVPIFTSFLISNVAQFTKSLLSRQLNRINYRNTTHVHNSELLSRLNDYERKFIADYSCYSITMDWPSLNDEDVQDVSVNSRRVNSETKLDVPVSLPISTFDSSATISAMPDSLRKRLPQSGSIRSLSLGTAQMNQLNVRVAFGADALLFAYRNLIKNLNQIKDRMRAFERRFGYFHLTHIYITGLITAQWVVFGLLQIRFSDAQEVYVSDAQEVYDLLWSIVWPDYDKDFVVRAVFSVLTYVAANTTMFVRADRMSIQLAKMRSQLFNFNIELTRSAIENQRTRERVYSVSAGNHWPELDQIWLLYDQAVRMSHKVRLRLGSTMVYEKNCLIQIFFGEVSAILVVIQLVDLYKLS